MSTLPSVRVRPSQPLETTAIWAEGRRLQTHKSVLIICAAAALLVTAFAPLVLPSSTGIRPEAVPSTEWLAEEVLGQDFELQFTADHHASMPAIASPFQEGTTPPAESEAPEHDSSHEEAKSTPVETPLKVESHRALANCR